MATKESNVFKECQMAAARLGATLLRNNRGLFLTLDGKRKVESGLGAAGSSDGIGWHTVTITPEMVGQRVAVFLAVETKSKGGRATADQARFLRVVREAGGIAVLAYSPDDVVSALK